MKIQSVTIDNFKGIRHLEISFVDKVTSRIRPVTTLLGDNGSGKTTVLQAIALVISLATRKTYSIEQFKWHGFLADRISSLGKTYIELELELDSDEVKVVNLLFNMWRKSRPTEEQQRKLVQPSNESFIRLVYDSGRVKAKGGHAKALELYGRYYIKTLSQVDPSVRKYFSEVGDIFWFDQYRNLGTGSVRDVDEKHQEATWQAGVEGLRDFLIRWWTYHVSKPDSEQDFLAQLERHFSRIFGGAKFDGIEPIPNNAVANGPEFYFMLRRGDLRYDISEMSSGEQAVFSVLYDFVRLSISKSIVLIDELELHLHPPEQQMLYNSLEKIGPDSQYIITSHSPYLDAVIPDGHKIRLEGGRPCL